MEELLSLKWNNHRSTFLHILAVLRDKQLYTDATLACDGKLYSVHKLVLSTCSDYFSSMLDRTSCKSPVIVLKDIKSEDLEALLDYMYLGEVNVRQSDLATLIKAAECLRVKGLAVADDEPPPRKVRGSDTQGRRGDTSGSPPAKRKRRDIDDGRDDVRPSKNEARHSSPVHSSSNRPKSPLSNNHTSTTNRNSSSNNSISNNSNQDSTNTSRQELNNKNSGNTDFDECTPCVKVELEDNQDGVEDTEGDRNVGDTGGDSSTGDLGDSYNLTNEDFKEENDTEGGGDLANDLPEFLQQATSGYTHSSFAGPSFQPELSWQGSSNDGGGLAGSFAAAAASLSFGGSGSGASQDGAGHSNAAGASGSATVVVCPVCGKQLSGRNGKQKLQYHMLTHTGEKPFQCPYCSYRAALKFNLVSHIKNVHKTSPGSGDSSQHHGGGLSSQGVSSLLGSALALHHTSRSHFVAMSLVGGRPHDSSPGPATPLSLTGTSTARSPTNKQEQNTAIGLPSPPFDSQSPPNRT